MRHFKPPADLFGSRTTGLSLRTIEPLFASAGLGVWHLDSQTGKLWWSQRTREIHEVAPDFVPDLRTALRFYDEGAQSTVVDAMRKAQQDGSSWDISLPLRTASGRQIILRSCGLAVKEGGVQRLLLGICEDLTEPTRRAEEHARLMLVVQQMTNAAMITDRKGRTTWINPAFEQLTGYGFDDLVGRAPGDILQGPATDPATVRALGQAIRSGEPFQGEILNYRKDGSPVWVEINISPIRDSAGVVTGFVAIQSDISARHAAQELARRELDTRREAETLLRDMVDAVPTAISAYDRNNRLLVVNRMTQEIFPEHSAALRPGMPLEAVLRSWITLEESACEDVEGRIAELIKASDSSIAPYETLLSDGRWLLSAARRSPSGNLIWVRTDITNIKTAELAARELANRDPLTGLLNRSGFFEALARLADEGGRQSGHTGCGCLAVFDVDHFKSVNDVYGHEAGDRLLQVVARRLTRIVRDTDILARLGGDEFALFLPGIGPHEARARMGAIHASLCRLARMNSVRMQPSLSMGVALVGHAGDDHQELLRKADRALFEAKRVGRGRVVFYSDRLASELASQRHLAEGLRLALSSHRIEIALQPQMRLSDDAILSFEALARWKDGDNWIPPSAFVPAAEMHGLAEKLGRTVLRQALVACRQLRAISGDPITVGVNVGTTQLLSEGFADQVLEDLADAGLPPTALELEITETVLLDRSFARVEPGLMRLRDLGVRLALDDFGTGHASLSHLGALKIDTLKIDRTFVSAIGVDRRRELIARTIVGLARGLELDCIAEGVETPQQRAFLENYGCSHIQGYLIAKPLPLDDCMMLLRARQMRGTAPDRGAAPVANRLGIVPAGTMLR